MKAGTKISKKNNPFYRTQQTYVLKVYSGKRKRGEIFSKLIVKTPERRKWRRSRVFIVNLTYFTPFSTVSVIDFERVNVFWDSFY